VHCAKISPEFECHGQRSRSSGTKKTEKCCILFRSHRPLGRGPHAAFFYGAILGGTSTPVGKSAHAVLLFMRNLVYMYV